MHTGTYKRIARIYRDALVPLRVWGSAAIGKSKIMQSIAIEDGFHFEDLRLATQDVGDLIGIPYIDHSDNNKRGPVTRWAKPAWLARIWDYYDQDIPTMLMLEEKTRACKEVTQAAFQLLTERKIHEHELPPNCSIFALDNPPTDDYDVTPADKAENTRWGNVFIEASVEDWLEFSASHLSKEVTRFIGSNNSALVSDKGKVWDVDTIIFAFPRTWELADRIWRSEYSKNNKILEDNKARAHLISAIGALVGIANAQAYINDINSSWVGLTQILNGEKAYRDIKDAAQIMRLQFDMIHFLSWKSVCNEEGKLVHSRKDNLVRFVVDMSKDRKEYVVAIMKKLVDSNDNDKKKLARECFLPNADLVKVFREILGG